MYQYEYLYLHLDTHTNSPMHYLSFAQKVHFVILTLLCSASLTFTRDTVLDDPFPFSTDQTHITVWNGEYYSPLFIKGINMGVAIPGTFPGELAASSEDYARWFRLIRDAGYNTIRVYTLHFPRFYEELDRFNRTNPNYPLYLFHGVWLQEEVEGYDEDLFSLTELFDQEIRENVSAIHGDVTISQRRGKAYGTYQTDISDWVIGYIIGREIHPPEVLHTNDLYPDLTSYQGEYLSIKDTQASEVWLLERMDYLLKYEMDNYGTQRPISASSWPTLDPLDHPFEEEFYEVSASIDFNNVDISNAKAGFFASYHAYPYYPNYISRDPKYTPFHDHLGQNSYLGYLTFLKAHYERFPLIIAEFGGSSSWGVAKYAHSGMHHGGYSEREQGENTIRMLKNMSQAGTGGGIQFALMDEWFKRTWINDITDFDIERRIIWHNATAAEQNFGIIGFQKPFDGKIRWQDFSEDDPITSVEVSTNFSYLKLRLNIQQHIAEDDTVWVALDTYDANLGESLLPTGETISNRAEFLLMITNYKAELFVTEAYDLFGIWHNISGPEQLYRSVVSDDGRWNLVRWKNDMRYQEVQDIGSLRLNRLGLPKSSKDGVRLDNDKIEIILPWTLLNFTDPSRATVVHDDRSVPGLQTRSSDGLALAISYNDFFGETESRYLWEFWNHALNAEEFKKASYYVIQEEMGKLPGNPIARSNHYRVGVDEVNYIPSDQGLLTNDLSLDGSPMEAILVEPPLNGLINLEPNGAFSYLPISGFRGQDSFRYRTRAGANISQDVMVSMSVEGTPVGSGFVSLNPNPATSMVTLSSTATMDSVIIFNIMGQRMSKQDVNARQLSLNVSQYPSGVYYARIHSGSEFQVKKFTVFR